jgi:GT2 family glycosyltransferase
MPPPRVTVIVVPRERYSQTERSLEDLYEKTTLPFDLIYVDAGSPGPVRRYLDEASRRLDFRLIRVDRYLGQNAARNLARPHAKTEFVVFLDNDVLLTPGWLEGILQCADETGASVVGPLYLEGELDQDTIHMAGGVAHFTQEDGESVFYDEHHLAGSRLSDVRGSLARKRCDYVEFHCTLVRNDVLEKLGPLDEEMRSIHEHIDLGLQVRRAGGSVYVEPGSVVSYIPPPPCEWSDLPFFMTRWSDDWNAFTLRRFKEKWGYSHVRFFGEDSASGSEETILRWARGHRRLMTGLTVTSEGADRPESARQEAHLMAALFLSVERQRFDLVLEGTGGRAVEAASGVTTLDLFDRLSEMLERADHDELDLRIRPLATLDHPVAVLRLDDLEEERMERMRRFAFLVLETRAGTYQCWLAIGRGDRGSAALWRRLGVSATGAADPVPMPGSRRSKTRLVHGSTGLIQSLSTLESAGLFPILRPGVLA